MYKCNCCGADMEYSPERHRLVCYYCDASRDIKKLNTHKRDFFAERNESEVDSTMASYKCPNCGGEVEMDAFVTADKCPFCGATNIIKQEEIKGLKPDGIIPFSLSKDNAVQTGKQWLKKRWYANKKFKNEFKAENVKGVYFPAFNFSANTYSSYSGRLGKYYYVTVGSGKDRHQERRTEWFNIRGNYSKYYDNILIESSKQLTQSELKAIMPYDNTLVEGYNCDYMAGFSAERYNEDIDVSFDKAKGEMGEYIKRAVLSQYTYDVVGSLNINTNYDPVCFNYLLLPMWVFGCKFKDKIYRFIVNGLTGKSYGKYPKSSAKIFTTVLACLGVAVGLILLILYVSGII